MATVGTAYSKINLFLKVTRRRPDGYHELATLFLPLSEPCDRIRVDWNADAGIRVSGSAPGLPEDLDNLAGRAAARYAECAGIEPAWAFQIEKRIPVAAGMGGGSSDAAAVLRLLDERFRALPPAELARIALELGADVPFFLHNRAAAADGIGEKLRFTDGIALPGSLLIVNPKFPVSAKWAYTHLAPELIGPDDAGERGQLIESLRRGDVETAARLLRNDLGPALFRKFPLLRMLRRTMLENGALAAEITGSGPTLFALCPDDGARRAVRNALLDAYAPESLLLFDGKGVI